MTNTTSPRSPKKASRLSPWVVIGTVFGSFVISGGQCNVCSSNRIGHYNSMDPAAMSSS